MIKTFKSFLIENTSPVKLTHLTHIEDFIFDRGRDGVKQAIDILKNIFKQMTDKNAPEQVKLSFKFDGSPSLVWGIDPHTKKFFVGTKSVFAKTPKINYTMDDIDLNHPEPGLNLKLKYALKYLRELKPKTVYQGDIAFTEGDIKEKEIDGLNYLIFRPNTITYAIPAESELADVIRRAKIGIVLHTRYKGSTIQNMTASNDIDLSVLKPSKNVWYESANFNNINDKTALKKEDVKYFESKTKELNSLGRSLPILDEIKGNKKLHDYILLFDNSLIKLREEPEPKEKVQKLVDFITDKFNTDIDVLKTEKGKNKKIQEKEQLVDYLIKNAQPMVKVYVLQKELTELKLKIVNELEQLHQMSTFLDDGSGNYNITKPEGFVASTKDGVVKLIDRNTFSAANFNLAKEWGPKLNV